MTAGVLLQIMLRRWLIVGVGLVLTVWACLVLAPGERTYWAKVDLVFVQPGAGSVVNVSDNVVPSLINFAGIIQRRVSHDGTPVELPSSSATLYGTGVRNGYSITLPNSGTQWAVSYSRPVLVVQAVGNSPDQVSQTLGRVLTQVESTAHELQTGSGAAADQFIVVDRSPSSPEIVDLGSTKLGRTKGILALSAVGLALTAFFAFEVDRIVLGRPLSRGARGGHR